MRRVSIRRPLGISSRKAAQQQQQGPRNETSERRYGEYAVVVLSSEHHDRTRVGILQLAFDLERVNLRHRHGSCPQRRRHQQELALGLFALAAACGHRDQATLGTYLGQIDDDHVLADVGPGDLTQVERGNVREISSEGETINGRLKDKTAVKAGEGSDETTEWRITDEGSATMRQPARRARHARSVSS